MELKVVVPDDLGLRVQALPDPDAFVTQILRAAFEGKIAEQPPRSRWETIARRIEDDPDHLDGYSEKLIRDAREVRQGLVLGDPDSE